MPSTFEPPDGDVRHEILTVALVGALFGVLVMGLVRRLALIALPLWAAGGILLVAFLRRRHTR